MNDSSVSIGEAAALYDLNPSTMRWWERQGVLDRPARDGGRRIYRDADLRRVGLAYLCCVVGKMPLEQAAVVTSGNSSHDTWQRTVGEQIGVMERQMEQLRAARDYLCHLLCCEDDDMAECSFLEGELFARTPRGRAPGGDLVTAARTLRGTRWRRGVAPDGRDENEADRSSRDENRAPCTRCRGPVMRTAQGRPRKYCSRACQQRAYRARQDGRTRATGASPAPPGRDRGSAGPAGNTAANISGVLPDAGGRSEAAAQAPSVRR